MKTGQASEPLGLAPTISSAAIAPARSDVERALTGYERLVWLLDRSIPANLVVYVGVTGGLTEELVRAGLDNLQKRHPLLRARVTRHGWSGARYTTQGVGRIPLRVCDAPQEGLRQELERQLNEPLETERGPLIRGLLVRHDSDLSTLSLAVHHCIGDGFSTALLIRDIMSSIESATRGEDDSLPPLAAGPPVGDRYPDFCRGLAGAKTCMALYKQLSSQKKVPTLFPEVEKWVPPWERTAQLTARRLEPEWTEEVVRTARRKRTTLMGVLVAANLLAVARQRAIAERRRGLVGITINLRRQLVPPMDAELGNAAAVAFSDTMVDPDSDVWDLARETRVSLSASVRRNEPFGFLKMGDYSAAMLRLLGSGPAGSKRIASMLSNPKNPSALGVIMVGRDLFEKQFGPFSVVSSGAASPPSANGSFLSICTVRKNLLAWNFLSSAPLHSRETTDCIADSAMNIVREAVDDGDR